MKNIYGREGSGKILIYGDSNCIDSSYLVNDCFDLFRDILRFLENKNMLIFNEFHNYKLPLDYQDSDEQPLYWADWNAKKRFMKYSKFGKKMNYCKKVTIYDKDIIIKLDEYEKKYLKSIHYDYTSKKIDKWVTNQKINSNYFWNFDLILTTEYIQIFIMVLSIIVLIFVIVLIRKKKTKKYNYSELPNKDPIILV